MTKGWTSGSQGPASPGNCPLPEATHRYVGKYRENSLQDCPGRWGGVEAGARQAGSDGAVSSAPLEGGSKPGLKDRYTR